MNKNILNYSSEVEKFYYSPIVELGYGVHNGDYLNLFVFLAKDQTISGVSSPSEINLTPSEIKQLHKNLIVLKKANLNDISPVIERVDWEANEFYFAYNHEENLSVKDSYGKLIKKFYVRNRFDQVFKCLWNGIDSSGTFDISEIANNSTHYTITHEGGTFDVDSLITIQFAEPEEYNGTYKIVSSAVGTANVICGFEETYAMSVSGNYIDSGTIKPTVLSTEEPVLDTRTFNVENIIYTSDGYKWKYLYTIDKGAKLKFFDTEWMPVPVNNILKYPYTNNVGWGSIDVINIIDGGNNYTNGTNTVNILVSGDGENATAEAYVANNVIQEIVVLNKGYDYTFANVSIIPETGFGGSGAIVDFSISPIGGHGYDFPSELYSSNLMVSVSFNGNENGDLPDEFKYNQTGILYNPYIKADTTNHTNTSFISCTTDMVTTSVGISYTVGEYVYQGISLESGTFSGIVLNFDSANNILSLINTTGTPRNNFELFGIDSGASKVVQQINESPYIPNTGTIFYAENRVDVDKDVFGNEQIRILIKYS